VTVPLFELGVPIRTLGEQEALGAFARVESAGKRAALSLEQSAKQGTQRATIQFSQMGANSLRALNAETAKARPSFERQGTELARSLTAGLRRQFARQQAEIREELARGLITPAQAQARGREAGLAFNRGVLTTISQQGAAGAFAGRQGGALFVGLSNQLRNVDQAASRAGRGGIRTLTTNLASLAAMELGIRAGLGSTIGILGTLAIGSALTLGIVAGLAAIAFAFGKIRDRAKEAEERVKKTIAAVQESSEALKGMLAEQMPLETAQTAVGTAEGALKLADSKFKKFEADRKTALEELTVAQGRLNAMQSAMVVPVAEIAALNTATKRLRDVETELTISQNEQTAASANLRVARFNLTKAEKEAADQAERLRKEQEQAAEALIRAYREQIQALAALASAGIATSDDLAQLATIQERLTAATKVGTAEARAQAQALLEVVRAARLSRLEGALKLGELEPKLSKTSPPGSLPVKRAAPLLTDADLGERGFTTAIRAADLYSARLMAVASAMGITLEQAEALTGFFDGLVDSLDPVNQKIAVLSTVLNGAAQAWVGFWEGVGSGDLSGFGNVIAGFAKQMAALFAQQAAAAAVLAITPPFLGGNPAYLALVPKFLAVSAGFAALAGGAGGSRSSGGGGAGAGSRVDHAGRRIDNAGRPIDQRDRFQEFLDQRERYPLQATPRLRGPQFGIQAAQVKPLQPISVQVGPIIGENDPVAQRTIARMTEKAAARGYQIGRGR
jgi:hypothetical protein